jgi:hypothetical protein
MFARPEARPGGPGKRDQKRRSTVAAGLMIGLLPNALNITQQTPNICAVKNELKDESNHAHPLDPS